MCRRTELRFAQLASDAVQRYVTPRTVVMDVLFTKDDGIVLAGIRSRAVLFFFTKKGRNKSLSDVRSGEAGLSRVYRDKRALPFPRVAPCPTCNRLFTLNNAHLNRNRGSLFFRSSRARYACILARIVIRESHRLDARALPRCLRHIERPRARIGKLNYRERS